MMQEAIGWLASVTLLVTIGYQVLRQYRSGTSEGVSKWLFVGQIAASAGFTTYSWLVGNWVFIITNALLLVSAIIGLGIVLVHRRREGSGVAAAAALLLVTGAGLAGCETAPATESAEETQVERPRRIENAALEASRDNRVRMHHLRWRERGGD